MRIASVAVEGVPFFNGGEFDYLIPESLSAQAAAGARVVVPFGRGSGQRAGFILGHKEETNYTGKLKSILSVAADPYLVSGEMLDLARWMSEQYICPVYDCLRAMLPAGLEIKIENLYLYTGAGTDLPAPDGLAGEIYGHIRAHEKADEKSLISLFGEGARRALKTLCTREDIKLVRKSSRKLGDNTVKTVCIDCPPDRVEQYLRGESAAVQRHRPILNHLLEYGECDQTDLCYMSGATPAMLNTLKKHGLVAFGRRQALRIPMPAEKDPAGPDAPLTAAQRRCADDIAQNLNAFGVDLLYGVTGSGKTHIFYALIDRVLAAGRGVIVMVPEIMLTIQLAQRLKARYGQTVALMHSSLSAGQRLDEWKRLRQGDAKIAVGTRSAVFAPLDDIGLIILDEEQEHTYKSELTPRFHARSAALRRAVYHDCPVLLSSATPAMESRFLAAQERYRYHTLSDRFNGKGAPKTLVVDMRAQLKGGNTSVYSTDLQQHLAQNLQNGEQSILFINRRGFNTFVSCRGCGTAVSCPHCSIAMTYHIKNHRLLCHYCGYSIPAPHTCPECDSDQIRYFGAGTQKAELELAALFPGARILRMDADTTAARLSHENMLAEFSDGKYDILLGTQMVTKGLDFPNVTLVGVLAADASLYSDDYRAGERTFSLITQVIGRAGRAAKPGRAIIQTYSPGHETLSYGIAQDYEGFYRHELALRKVMLYPPYSDLCQVVFSHEQAAAALAGAERFKQALVTAMEQAALPMAGLGPAPCKMARLHGRYRYHLILKCRAESRFRNLLREQLSEFVKNKENKDVELWVDVNPYNIQ